MKKNFYSLGLMSGTSLDGIDASIIKSDGEQFVELIDDLYLKYDDKLKKKIRKITDLCSTKDDFKRLSKEISKLEKEITMRHVKACKLIIKKNKNIKIDLIGFHGQTIIHKPKEKFSVQIGNSKLLSKLTKIAVVSNFRKNDILNGGQGAPLTPIFHKLILKKINKSLPSAIINIGGISNITYLDSYDKLISFDTGPGNYLIDTWVKSNTKKEFDNKGLIAQKGQPNYSIIKKFLKNKYYKKKHPKSLDIKDFDLQKINKLNFKDGCATLSMLTVETIGLAVKSFNNFVIPIIISGGGRKNKFIIKNIKRIIKNPVKLIDEYGFDGDFIESQAFAYLAIRSYLKKFITFPNTTGVIKPCLGGFTFKH